MPCLTFYEVVSYISPRFTIEITTTISVPYLCFRAPVGWALFAFVLPFLCLVSLLALSATNLPIV